MKSLLILLILSFGMYASATSFPPNPPVQALCMESGQDSPFIMAEIYENEATVELKYMNMDGTEQSKVELMGTEPDLSINHVTGEDGEKLIIIQSISATETGVSVKVLVCVE